MKDSKRNIYLEKKSLAEALDIFLSAFDFDKMIGTEEIRTKDSLGRVTAAPVFARLSSPNYSSAAMDGIAVLSDDTYGATETNPKRLKIGKETVFINTGNPMPKGKDAVIMIEDVHEPGDGTVEIIRAALPWQHVRTLGEDIVATELLLPSFHIIRPYDIGALLGVGHTNVTVKKRPKILFIPTGDELFDPDVGDMLPEGMVYESNSAVIGSMAMTDGAEVHRHKIVCDKFDEIRRVVSENIDDFDIVIVIAGSSAGSRDYTRSVFEEIGEVFVHGISMMPGKPTILGRIAKKPTIGLPGYPVSAVMTYHTVIRPLIAKMLGILEPTDEEVEVTVLRDIPSKIGNDEFLRVRIADVDGVLVASPLPRGAGNITTMVRADGFIKIDSLSEGLKARDKARAYLARRKSDIANVIMCVGSHDISLDLLGDELKLKDSRYSLASVNVGSLGGIIALKNGECHLSGSHLLDPKTGAYNIPDINKHLPGLPVVLLTLAHRQQGLIVPKGNPDSISGISDLTREGLTFINRQRGSGTRILLDFSLKQLDIDPKDIDGYRDEEFTHMNVAARVKGGSASLGLGIKAAANALDLDFVPTDEERYDLIIPISFTEKDGIKTLIEIIESENFKKRIIALGGYDTRDTGKKRTIRQ
jgi:putative molybdopterin biosynthesis protein